jgi:hypothetical protein
MEGSSPAENTAGPQPMSTNRVAGVVVRWRNAKTRS